MSKRGNKLFSSATAYVLDLIRRTIHAIMHLYKGKHLFNLAHSAAQNFTKNKVRAPPWSRARNQSQRRCSFAATWRCSTVCRSHSVLTQRSASRLARPARLCIETHIVSLSSRQSIRTMHRRDEGFNDEQGGTTKFQLPLRMKNSQKILRHPTLVKVII